MQPLKFKPITHSIHTDISKVETVFCTYRWIKVTLLQKLR